MQDATANHSRRTGSMEPPGDFFGATMLARDSERNYIADLHQSGSTPQKPAPDSVNVGALSGAVAMETLKVEIVQDGKVVQVIEVPDPRLTVVTEWNARYGDSSQARAA